jgi:ribulose-5-phosphate 4-epimerase/fuculose-1-phosphate aldolase
VIEAKTDLESVEEVENDAENSVEEQVVNDEVVNLEEAEADDSVEEPSIEENEPITDEVESETSEEIEDALVTEEVVETNISSEISEGLDLEVQTNVETEAEIARLSAEVERLRRSMAGAAEVIEELENPPMPPAVMDNLVIGAHIVGDMARLARQLDREQLIRASMGTIAMLHPEQLEIIVSTKHMALLPRMDERDICAAKLGVEPPRGAPTDWRVLEVVLASVSLITGGPAAVIHSHGPFTTAASCEKDLVLVQPIDEIGKKHIGKIIIVDPDDENPEEFLRQVAEALQQGGMRCVVIRGMGAYSVGADLDQAWANAAMLEHSMKIVLLARQANLKV